jgi:hypothetical protein
MPLRSICELKASLGCAVPSELPFKLRIKRSWNNFFLKIFLYIYRILCIIFVPLPPLNAQPTVLCQYRRQVTWERVSMCRGLGREWIRTRDRCITAITEQAHLRKNANMLRCAHKKGFFEEVQVIRCYQHVISKIKFGELLYYSLWTIWHDVLYLPVICFSCCGRHLQRKLQINSRSKKYH